MVGAATAAAARTATGTSVGRTKSPPKGMGRTPTTAGGRGGKARTGPAAAAGAESGGGPARAGRAGTSRARTTRQRTAASAGVKAKRRFRRTDIGSAKWVSNKRVG